MRRSHTAASHIAVTRSRDLGNIMFAVGFWRGHFMRNESIARVVLIVCLAACCFGAFVQDSEVGVGFKRLSVEEVARLRAVLAEPVPERALCQTLEAHFSKKGAAANRLDDEQAQEVVLRQWAEALPKAWLPRDRLAFLLHNRGQFDEAIRFRHQAIELVPNQPLKACEFSALAEGFLVAGRDDEAQKAVDVARQYIVETDRSNWNDSGLLLLSGEDSLVRVGPHLDKARRTYCES